MKPMSQASNDYNEDGKEHDDSATPDPPKKEQEGQQQTASPREFRPVTGDEHERNKNFDQSHVLRYP
jgi:hypothetical protein